MNLPSGLIIRFLQLVLLFHELILHLRQAMIVILHLEINVHRIDLFLQPDDLVRVVDVESIFVQIKKLAGHFFLLLATYPRLLISDHLRLHLLDKYRQFRPQFII